MDTLFIPSEIDFKRWIKDAVKEFFQDSTPAGNENERNEDDLLNRQEIAKFLRISLVTLNDWVNRGLPSHKQRGRVYFDKTEVKDYIKANKIRQIKFGTRHQRLRNEIA